HRRHRLAVPPRRRRRRRPAACRGAGDLPDGVRALRAAGLGHLAARIRHLQPDRGDLSRRALRAADPRPRERGSSALVRRAARALRARPGRARDHLRVLRPARRLRRRLLVGGVGQRLARPDGVAAAPLDPVFRAAARHGPARAAVPGSAARAAHRARGAVRRLGAAVNELQLGLLVALVTIAVLLTGAPVAFCLGIVAIGFLVWSDGLHALGFVPDIFYGALDSFAFLSIPLFILMGGAVASSRAGADLYEALDRWLHRVPGGLLASNLGACAIFAALSGSSPATCAAIGKMGVPEMRNRGYPDGVATGSIAAGGTLGILIPPSITLVVYGVATEPSIGSLFAAGSQPGLMLTALFIAWGIFGSWRHGYQVIATDVRFTLRQKLEVLPKVGPFLLVIVAVLYVLYGGVATPSEAAAVGALFVLVLVAVIYRL